MPAGGAKRWIRAGWRGVVAAAACSAGMLALGAVPAQAAGGPVILGGDDLTDHGSRDTAANVNRDGWLYLEKALENVAPAVTRAGSNGSIAALGSADSTSTGSDAGAAIHFAAQDAGAGLPVTYYNGGAAISQLFADLRAGVAKPAIIWIAGDGASNDLSDDATEATALADNATTIADFVNAGGGLISHGSEYGWLAGLLPGASSVRSGASSDLVITGQGQAAFPGLTDADVNAGPWHSYFEGNLGGLSPLVRSTSVDDSTGADARVIVGGATAILPGSISLDPPNAVKQVNTNHTVTATVRNDQGQLRQGATVTFTITSGPNQGDTATAVTDAAGQATFTWTGDGGEGTDVVQASFVASDGGTRTATARIDWTVLPVIPLLPLEGIPVVVAATAAVALLWYRRQRRRAPA